MSDGIAGAVVDEPVVDFLVHHEPTFDHDEIRRHVTVVVLTDPAGRGAHRRAPGRRPAAAPYTATTTESVALDAVRSVVVNRMVAQQAHRPRGRRADGPLPSEAVMTVAWGAIRRVDLEPAACSDPDCDADHGYTGTVTADDFSLRVSATADGAEAVERVLEFTRTLSHATVSAAARA